MFWFSSEKKSIRIRTDCFIKQHYILFFVQVGQFNQLNLTLINIAFIFTIAGYLYKLLNDNIKEFEVLNQIRYFAGDDSILNYNLTKRELEIADLILKDLSYPEISAKVFLAE